MFGIFYEPKWIAKWQKENEKFIKKRRVNLICIAVSRVFGIYTIYMRMLHTYVSVDPIYKVILAVFITNAFFIGLRCRWISIITKFNTLLAYFVVYFCVYLYFFLLVFGRFRDFRLKLRRLQIFACVFWADKFNYSRVYSAWSG